MPGEGKKRKRKTGMKNERGRMEMGFFLRNSRPFSVAFSRKLPWRPNEWNKQMKRINKMATSDKTTPLPIPSFVHAIILQFSVRGKKAELK